jgi:hypothetical protein
VGVALVGVVLALLLPASPALAHGAVDITIHSDGSGAIRATLIWSDGDQLTQAAAGSLFATTTDGRRVGPVGMTRVPGSRHVLVYPGPLPPGAWHVAVDVAVPAIGHCETDVVVAAPGASPSPGDTICRAPPLPSTAGAAAAPDPGVTLGLPMTFGLAVGVTAFVVGAIMTVRDRRRRR